MQRCGACKAEKPLEDFAPFYRGKPGRYCRPCTAAYVRGDLERMEHAPRLCAHCGSEYRPRQLKSAASYCSRACKEVARNAASAAAREAAKPPRICVHCGADMAQAMRSDAKFCSAECNYRAHALQRKLRARGGPGDTPGFVRVQVAERDRWTCGICGRKVDRQLQYPHPQAPSLDHVVPVSQGGTSEASNLRLTHLVCNLRRRDGGGGEQLALH